MATKYVDKTGNDANNGSTLVLAKLTLAGGESVASNGDTIVIGAGTWVENFGSKYLIYQGAGMFDTIINGNIKDNTIYGYGKYYDLTISLVSSEAARVDGGRYFYRVRFLGNGFGGPAGYIIYYGNPFVMSYSTFHDIHGTSTYAFQGSGNPTTFQISNCAFNHVGLLSAGLYQSTSSFVRNSAFRNCDFTGYVLSCTVDHNCANAGTYLGGADTIIADPLFVDATNGDLRLAAGSPCINKGQP
jgi:hypothetical protein